MDSIIEQAAKLSQHETAVNLGVKAGKGLYKYATDPVFALGIEAATAATHAVALDMINDKHETVGELAGDAVGMAGMAYAGGALTKMALQGLARTEYGSNLVGNAIDKTINKMKAPKAGAGGIVPHQSNPNFVMGEEKLTVGKLVGNSMRKFVKPVNMGRLAFGGAGMAAGLLYTMMNGEKDGAGSTAFNLLGGAGLAMMGHELYGHFQNKSIKEAEKAAKGTKTVKDIAEKSLNKFTDTKTGALWKEMYGEVMDSSAAKHVKDAMDNILKTEHGQAVKGAFESIMNSDWEGITKIAQNPDAFMENVNKTRDYVRAYMDSPEGKGALNSLYKEANVEFDINKKDLVRASREDFLDFFKSHMSKLRNGVGGANKFYEDNHEMIQKGLSHFFKPHEMQDIHNFMTGGLSKIAKGLDDIVSQGVLDGDMGGPTHGPKGLDTGEDTIVDQRKTKAKEVSEEFAHNEPAHEQVTVSKVEEQLAKEKHITSMKNIASQKKITNWFEKGKMLGAIGIGAFAVATVMDASDRLDHQTETSKMVNAEKQMKDKKQRDMERKYHQQAYGAINMGDMVTQMFQDRIGHHKMGNAKFGSNQMMIQGQTYTF
jgi:hypothetical protein